jgi:hypothetical protein
MKTKRKDFFVMLYHPNGSFVPLVEEDNEMMFFGTVKEADDHAKASCLGSEFGYETFQMGEGQ